MTTDPDCIFCKIVSKQIPANVVYQDDQVTAFNDLNPQAPTHVLLIPNQHIANTEALEPEHDATVGAVLRAARSIARSAGVADSASASVFRTPPAAPRTAHRATRLP